MGRGIVLSIVAATCTGCITTGPRNEPGTTYGSIEVSNQRVSGRERLINDRLEQERWLSNQLKNVDNQTFGISGRVDLRSLAYTSAQLRGQFDPSYGIYKLQQARNSRNLQDLDQTEATTQQFLQTTRQRVIDRFNKQEITADDAKSQLTALGITLPTTTISSGISATDKPAAPTSSLPSMTLLPGTALFGAATGASSPYVPPSASGAGTADIASSPIEQFLDKNAAREEIRGALLENGLDDAHDIAGNTLYRVTFDTTVIPQGDTSAWAIVEMEAKVPQITEAQGSEILEKTRLQVERSINNELNERYRLLSEALDKRCANYPLFVQAIECAVDLLGEKIAKSLVTTAYKSPKLRKSAFSTAIGDDKLPKYHSDLTLLLTSEVKARFDENKLSCYFDVGARDDFEQQPSSSLLFFARPSENVLARLGLMVVRPSKPPLITSFADSIIFQARRETLKCPDLSNASSELAKRVNERIRTSVYAVTPRETVHRISELGSTRTASEFLLGLSAVTGQAGVDSAFQALRANDALYQAAKRQPLIVGYGKKGVAKSNESMTFGWLLGPQFRLSDDGKSASFRHTVKQQPVSVTLSVPAWLDQLDITVTTRWQREDTGQTFTAGTSSFPLTFPARYSMLSQILADDEDRTPSVNRIQELEVAAGQRLQVLIRGDNLWRSPEVYVGGQKSDAVNVLSDMGGVRAVFDSIEAHNSAKGDGVANLMLITSEGAALAGRVHITAAKGPETVTSQGFGRRLVAGNPYSVDLSQAVTEYSDAVIVVSSPKDATLNASIPDTIISRDGRRVSFTLAATAVPKLATGDLVDVVLSVKRSPGAQPSIISVAKNVVFFKSSDDGQVQVSFVAQGKTLPLGVQLKFPKPVIQGFAALADGHPRMKATVILVNNDQLPLSDMQCNITKEACTVQLSAPPATMNKINNEASAPKVRFEFVDDDVPPLNPSLLPFSR